MHISCPHCSAAYEVGPMIKNAVLVCHRCRAEFSMDDELAGQQKKSALEETDQSLPLFEHATDQQHDTKAADPASEASSEESNGIPLPAFLDSNHEYTEKIKLERVSAKPGAMKKVKKGRSKKKDRANVPADEVQIPLQELKESTGDKAFQAAAHEAAKEPDHEETLPPARKRVVIWPWLIAMLLIISGTGFWFKQDLWLDHPWVRSLLINMHLPVEVRNKDWSVIPGSVQGHWLKRDDGSQVLTIQGRVENRLYCELPPPRILVQFFDDTGITESLGEKLLPITEPPSMEQIKHAPFVMPDIDRVPVEAQGERGFFLVLDSLPERTADFTLTPKVNREH